MHQQRRWTAWGLAMFALLAIALLVPATANAAGAHGVVTAVSADSITITPHSRPAQTFTVNAQTTITLDGAPATLSQILPDKQEATVASTDGTLATRIESRTRRAAAPHPAPHTPAPGDPATPRA